MRSWVGLRAAFIQDVVQVRILLGLGLAVLRAANESFEKKKALDDDSAFHLV